MTDKINETLSRYWLVITLLVSVATFFAGKETVSEQISDVRETASITGQRVTAVEQNVIEIKGDLKDIKNLLIRQIVNDSKGNNR